VKVAAALEFKVIGNGLVLVVGALVLILVHAKDEGLIARLARRHGPSGAGLAGHLQLLAAAGRLVPKQAK